MQNQNIEQVKFQYESAFEQAKNEVGRQLCTSPLIVREYTSHLAASTGKFIRAAALISCGMEKGGLVGEKAVKMAAAVELLHLATLVHDDVIDNADLRRGELTLQKKYGKRTAVICGDYLVCMAMKLAASTADKAEPEDYTETDIPDYMSMVCPGELNQHINSGNVDLTAPQYLRIIKGKTAALFEASFFTGAALAEKDRRIIDKYAKLGHNTGMIFQLTDDCMDFEETEADAKKPVQSDYEQDVITLPLIRAFEKLPELKKKAKKHKLSRIEINEAVREAGGLEYTRQLARKYYDRSLELIGELDLEEEKENRLKAILDKAGRFA